LVPHSLKRPCERKDRNQLVRSGCPSFFFALNPPFANPGERIRRTATVVLAVTSEQCAWYHPCHQRRMALDGEGLATATRCFFIRVFKAQARAHSLVGVINLGAINKR